MKKLILIVAIMVTNSLFSQSSSNNAKRDSEIMSPFNSYYDNNIAFKNSRANLEISQYYYDIKKYIKSKKQELSSENFKNLMSQNEKDFTKINNAVNEMSAGLFLEKYKEELENYKKKIFSQVDLLAKN